MAEQQSPRVVIAARGALIKQLGEIGGSRLTDQGREEIADWLISSGHLADSFYQGVAAELDKSKPKPVGAVELGLPGSKVKRTDPAVAS